MTNGSHGAALRQLRTLLERGAVGSLSDAELIDRFLSRRTDDADPAFAALVERHGPAVFRVCRSVLGDPEAAKDAFQATFLVLVRKAGSVKVRESIGPWLVAVAYRTASGARVAANRRRTAERTAGEVRVADESVDEDIAREVRDEVDRLADRYRRPILLCYFAGLTHEGAARQLGCPVGTVRSRLAWGRKQLRERLIRRGVVPSAALASLIAAPTRAAVPTTLFLQTARAASRLGATEAVSAAAVVQAERIMRAMFMSKLKGIAAAVLMTLAVVATGGAVLAQQEGGSGSSSSGGGASGGTSAAKSEAKGPNRAVRTRSATKPATAVRPDVEIEMLLRAAREQEQAGATDQALALTERMTQALEVWRAKLQRDDTRGKASQEANQTYIRRLTDVMKLEVGGDGRVPDTGTTTGSKANPDAAGPSVPPSAAPPGESVDGISVVGPGTITFDRNNGNRLILRRSTRATDEAPSTRPEAPKADSGSAGSTDAAPRSTRVTPDRPAREGEAPSSDRRNDAAPRAETSPDGVRTMRDRLSLQDVERAAAPFPETQTIKEPAGDRLSASEKRKNRTAAKLTTAQIQAALDRKIAVAIGAPNTILDAIEIIQTAARGPDGMIPISLDLSSLRRAGLKLDQRVALESKGITVAAALKAVVEPVGLTYQVKDGQVVIGLPGSPFSTDVGGRY